MRDKYVHSTLNLPLTAHFCVSGLTAFILTTQTDFSEGSFLVRAPAKPHGSSGMPWLNLWPLGGSWRVRVPLCAELLCRKALWEPHFTLSPFHPYQCVPSSVIVVRGVFLFTEETQGSLPLGAFSRGRSPPIASVDCTEWWLYIFWFRPHYSNKVTNPGDHCLWSDVEIGWEIKPHCLSETLGCVPWEPDGISKPGS